ncbi:MAG: hypothetical protein RL432_751 [Bacteroidota bacterium]|jgi:hypothetical protein
MDSCSNEKASFISIEGKKLHYVIDDLTPYGKSGHLMEKELQELDLITNKRRKIEYQSIRFLKNRFFRETPIEYLPNGKPYLPGLYHHIGISHSKNHAVFAYSKILFGCDIEEKDPRLFSVEERFTNPLETSRLEPFSYLDRLCMLWTSKESIFKLLGIMGIQWREQCTLMHVDLPILTYQLALQDRKIIVKCYVEQVNPSTWISFAFQHNYE